MEIPRTLTTDLVTQHDAEHPQGYSGGMELPEDTLADLKRRLARVEGQVRGVQAMLAEGRDCRDVVAQLSAARKALDQVGFKLLATGLATCVADPEKAAETGFDLAEVERLFLKLA
jgi:DNA-binding FrmR family transcriptional regulator